MFRRHLSNIIFLTLVIAVGGLYGFFVGAFWLPVWVTVCAITGVAAILGVIAEPIANSVLRWYDERQAVKAYEAEAGR